MTDSGIINLSRKNASFQAGYCFLKEEIMALKEKRHMLHPKEMEFFKSMKFERRQASYLLGRLSAKNAIAQLRRNLDLASIQIDSGIFDFPVVKTKQLSNVQVGISHCETIGISLAFPEEHPLGIDLEKITAKNSAVIKGQLCAQELEQIGKIDCTQAEGCTAIWSIKEAFSKILRTGLTANFKVLEVKEMVRKDGFFLCEFRHFGQYKAISYVKGDYLCSIVMPKNTTADLSDFWLSFGEVV